MPKYIRQRELRDVVGRGLRSSRSIHSRTPPPAMNMMQISQTLNSTDLMKSCANAPTTAAGRNASSSRARSAAPPDRRRTGGELPDAHEIDRQQRQDRAELDQDREGLAELLVGETEKVLDQQQMPVDDTGTNSVNPSTMPRTMDLTTSAIMRSAGHGALRDENWRAPPAAVPESTRLRLWRNIGGGAMSKRRRSTVLMAGAALCGNMH